MTNSSCGICNNTNNTGTGSGSVLSMDVHYAMGVYLTIIGTLAVTGNSFVIFVMLKGNAKYSKIYGKLVLNLAIADLLQALMEFPVTTICNFYGRYIFPDTFCTINGFWTFTMAMADMDTLAVMAICRYIVACKHSHERFINDKYSKRILSAIWGYALFWTGAPLVGWNSYNKEAYGTSCTINWASDSVVDRTYSGLIIIFCYFVHLVIFLYCYSNIIHSFRKASAMRLNQVNQNAENLQNNLDADSLRIETVVWYHKIITSRQMTFLSLAMVGTYILAWTPYAIVTAYVVFISPIEPWVHVIPTMMAKTACLTNPIVYVLSSSKFREATINIFCQNKSRVGPAVVEQIELNEQPNNQRGRRDSNHRLYRGDMTSCGIYIGRQQLALPVERHVF